MFDRIVETMTHFVSDYSFAVKQSRFMTEVDREIDILLDTSPSYVKGFSKEQIEELQSKFKQEVFRAEIETGYHGISAKLAVDNSFTRKLTGQWLVDYIKR